jgi:hypothetical protein
VAEVNQVRDLTLDDRLLAHRGLIATHAHELHRREDRRERIAQLVAEHRQELVLRAARLLCFGASCLRDLVQPCALECLTTLPADGQKQRLLLGIELALVIASEADRAERAPFKDDRNRAPRQRAELCT